MENLNNIDLFKKIMFMIIFDIAPIGYILELLKLPMAYSNCY